jgi:zinc and cadmium transporter
LKALVYAAMGVLLAVTFCDILPDAWHLLSWPGFLVGVASGYALFWGVGRYVYHLCPSCAISSFDSEATRRLGQSAILLTIALTIHSIMDGLAVVVSDRLALAATPGVLFAVSFHKLPEGIALILVLLGAGYSRRSALLWTFGIEATTELGGLVGVLALHHTSPIALGLIFAHVGGGFLYLAGNTLSAFVGAGSRRGRPDDIRSLTLSGGGGFLITSGLIYAMNLYLSAAG